METFSPTPPTFTGAYPIGDTDIAALPVRHLAPAIAFYTLVLGFALVSRDSPTTATLRRGDAVIGLSENDTDPTQASVYFAVNGVSLLRDEYAAHSLDPSPLCDEAWDGTPRRIFFAREPYGVCFCFGETVV